MAEHNGVAHFSDAAYFAFPYAAMAVETTQTSLGSGYVFKRTLGHEAIVLATKQLRVFTHRHLLFNNRDDLSGGAELRDFGRSLLQQFNKTFFAYEVRMLEATDKPQLEVWVPQLPASRRREIMRAGDLPSRCGGPHS